MFDIQEYEFSPEQHVVIDQACQDLAEIGQRMNDGQAVPETIKQLYALYFKNQMNLSDTPAGHILRVLPEDLIIEFDVDFDEGRKWYQNAMEAYQRKSRLESDRKYLRSIGSPLADGLWFQEY